MHISATNSYNINQIPWEKKFQIRTFPFSNRH